MTRNTTTDKKKDFELLFIKYYKPLCIYAMRFISSKTDAEEIVQNAFMKFWELFSCNTEFKSIQAYLYKSVYNNCVNYLKHESYKATYISKETCRLKQLYLQEAEKHHSSGYSEIIKNEIDNLPALNKKICTLRLLHGYNTKEVSKMLGLTPRSVESYMSRTFKLLRKKLIGTNEYAKILHTRSY